MKRRKLGQSELSVTPLVLGGNVFGWTADEPTSFVEQHAPASTAEAPTVRAKQP